MWPVLGAPDGPVGLWGSRLRTGTQQRVAQPGLAQRGGRGAESPKCTQACLLRSSLHLGLSDQMDRDAHYPVSLHRHLRPGRIQPQSSRKDRTRMANVGKAAGGAFCRFSMQRHHTTPRNLHSIGSCNFQINSVFITETPAVNIFKEISSKSFFSPQNGRRRKVTRL